MLQNTEQKKKKKKKAELNKKKKKKKTGRVGGHVPCQDTRLLWRLGKRIVKKRGLAGFVFNI